MLTDHQISEIYLVWGANMVDFARAIEAKIRKEIETTLIQASVALQMADGAMREVSPCSHFECQQNQAFALTYAKPLMMPAIQALRDLRTQQAVE